jgi:hypothetical protein
MRAARAYIAIRLRNKTKHMAAVSRAAGKDA